MGGSLAQVNLPAALSSAAYNANSQLTNWNGTTLTYDADGNLTNDGTTAYAWNARNQLSAFGSIGFLYDGVGRRTQNATGKAFLYDGANAVQELSGSTVTAKVGQVLLRWLADPAGATNGVAMGFANRHLLCGISWGRVGFSKDCQGGTWRARNGYCHWFSTGTLMRLDYAGRSQGDCGQMAAPPELGPFGDATKVVFPWALFRSVGVDCVRGFSRRTSVIGGVAFCLLTSDNLGESVSLMAARVHCAI